MMMIIALRTLTETIARSRILFHFHKLPATHYIRKPQDVTVKPIISSFSRFMKNYLLFSGSHPFDHSLFYLTLNREPTPYPQKSLRNCVESRDEKFHSKFPSRLSKIKSDRRDGNPENTWNYTSTLGTQMSGFPSLRSLLYYFT